MQQSRSHRSTTRKLVFEAILVFCLLVISQPETSLGQLVRPNVRAVVVDEDIDDADAVENQGALPRMNRQQMEEYMYNSLGGSKAAFHKLKRESIRRELDRVNSICTLTDEQWVKLNEAIEVDIQHIENKMTSLLSDFDGRMTQQKLQEMQQNIWQFASTVDATKKDKKAVWCKVLRSQLTQEQLKKIELEEVKKQANKARTNHLKNLIKLQRKLGLNASQRLRIEDWLKQHSSNSWDFSIVCLHLSQSSALGDMLRNDQIKKLTEPVDTSFPIDPPLPEMNEILK